MEYTEEEYLMISGIQHFKFWLNDPLLVDFYRIIAQKQIPKLSLLRSRCAAQSACSAKHFIIFVDCGVFHERLPLR